MNQSLESAPEGDVFKILVATDLHLGYEETNHIRGQDTFDTFEEILQIAEGEEVDFILLGGDLFHHAKPSPYCIYKCTELLKKYCFGDTPVGIELLSDGTKTFSTSIVNYEDPNLNVAIPVFSIHGNHDDPTGQKQISAMDLLATSGLLNYFGKCKSYEKVEIEPVCLKKGETNLAIYGLSHIKDERLGRLFLDDKVKFKFGGNTNDWFHLLVWHQNRAARGNKNYIPDDLLPDMLDLVIWGHEHDCRIIPEPISKLFISQPGSSVATSLVEGEAKTKHVGILRVYKNKFIMNPIELRTVRPFIYQDLVLRTVEESTNITNASYTPSELTQEIVREKIEEMISNAKALGRTPRVSERPLIRLNVKCRDERQVFNTIRFGQDYIERVANPQDMVKCHMIKERAKRSQDNAKIDDNIVATATRVEDIVLTTFEENDLLVLLSASAINEAVKKFVDTNDTDAVSGTVEFYKKEVMKKLEETMPEIADIEQAIKNFKIEKEEEALQHLSRFLADPNRGKKLKSTQATNKESHINGGNVDTDDRPMSKGKVGEHSKSGQSSKRITKRKRYSDDEEVVIIDDQDNDEDLGDLGSQTYGRSVNSYFDDPQPTRGRGSRGGKRAGRRGRGK